MVGFEVPGKNMQEYELIIQNLQDSEDVLQKSKLYTLVHQEFQVPKMEVRKPT